VSAYLKRLVTSLAAYQVADVVSKFIAVILLPIYTRYVSTHDYGVVELLANTVIFVSIVVRFGMIEAFIRFYFSDEDQARRDALARRATIFLLLATTIVAGAAAIAAAPLSAALLGHRDVTTFLIAVLGLWTFTNLELAYGLLRVEERTRAYAIAALTNVGLTVAVSIVLVVGLKLGARGLLLGNYGVSTLVLFALWGINRGRLLPSRGPAERLAVLLRFGLPTVPAEASVYALNLVDRYYIYHHRSASQAGVYSIAVKLAGSVAFVVRAFQYAWPPLAYSVKDDAEAARLYGLVTTYYVLVCGTAVAGLALFGRWIVRLLTAPSYHHAYQALPWLALGWALYGLFVVLVVVAGRAKVTSRNFFAAAAGLAANIALLLVLVPQFGLAGAGAALCGAYLVMLVVMHFLTRRLFMVTFEWTRLAQLTLVIGAVAVAGDALLPAHGLAGLLARAAAFLAIPGALMAMRFLHPEEVVRLRALARRGLAHGRA
jgi:O-antigen/teichoic acid export membrane protein